MRRTAPSRWRLPNPRIVATNNPAAKTPPACYLLINVVNGGFVRSPADPATGFNRTDAPDNYRSAG